MIRVLLLKYINEVAACKVNPLSIWVISHVINHVPTRKAGNNGAEIRIKNYQLFGIAGGNKQAMSSFVKAHRDIVLRFLPNWPGRNDCSFFPINDANRVF